MSRLRSGIALTAAATSLFLGCKLEPDAPELVYSLNEGELAKHEALAARESAKAQLDGALRMLFGTPSAPAFLALEEWTEDEGFYPNYWTQDTESEKARDARMVENREYFAEQIAALENRSPVDVERSRYAPDLWEWWEGHLELLFDEEGPDGDLDYVIFEEDGEEITWLGEAIYQFENYYPTLATSAEMYRQQCYHCHGASGGGDGSTAPYLNPRPRDYRAGKFKFTALADKARPRHEDLIRILHDGIYTTSMPSFARFPRSMLSGLADYVRLLSIRGETEILTMSDYDDFVGLELQRVIDNYELTIDRWREADEKVIAFDGEVPESTPERIERGRALYLNHPDYYQDGKGANCVSCHGVSGRGDGLSAWETGKAGEEYVKDDWGNEISPRNLTRGIYRFGRRPIDLYRRIHAGINGTPMPAHYDMQVTLADGSTRRLDDDDIWDLVFYIRAMPELSGREGHDDDHAEDGGEADGHAEEEGH